MTVKIHLLKINFTGIFRCLIATVLILLFCEKGMCEEKKSGLEYFWQLIEENNPEIKAAERNLSLSEKSISFFRQGYVPQITFSSTSSFSDVTGEAFENPAGLSSKLNLHEDLSGGLSFDLGTNLKLNANSLSVTAKNEYTDVENLEFSVNQSLYPYWLQKVQNDSYQDEDGKQNFLENQRKCKNPEKQSALLEKEISSIYLELVKKEEIENFTSDFIQLRETLRNIESTEKYIEYYEKLISSMKENSVFNGNSWKDIFVQEENLAEYESDLADYISERESLYGEMLNALGTDDTGKDEFMFCILKQDLPEINRRFDSCLNQRYLNLQKTAEIEEYKLNKQNNAPFLSFGGNFPLHDGYDKSDVYGAYLSKENRSWYLSLSVTFTPLFFNKKNKLEENHQKSVMDFDEKIREFEFETSIEKENLCALLQNGERRLESIRRSFNNSEILKHSMEESYLSGACSQIDLSACQLECDILKNQIENCQDWLWFYKWVEANR